MKIEQFNENPIYINMKSAEFLELRKQETLAIINSVKTEFEGLSAEQFNAKPSPRKWSISECLQHLNLTFHIYIPQMVAVVKQPEKYPIQTEVFKHSFLGKMAVKSMTPKPDKTIGYKMKTFGNLKPQQSKGNRSEVINEFMNYQQSILEVIEGLKDMSLTKPKIITAAGSLVKMRIGDALHFMIAHNQRHLVQAQNILETIT